MTSSARARRPVGRKRRRMGFSGQVLAPLLRSLSSQRVVDLGNFPSRSQSRVPFRAPVRRPFVVSTVGDSLETFAEGSPNSSQIVLAVAHGNRTHRGRLSAPATGFEDRASHQIRKRYRLVLTLKLGQTDNIFWVWCRAGAVELHEPGVGEIVRAPLGDRDEEGGGRGDRPSLILSFLPLDLLIERVKEGALRAGL